MAIGSGFQLGIDGMVLEVVHFRSAAAEGCSDPGVLAHELPTTRLLLAELSPRVIVANGADALWAVQLLWPSLQDQLALRTPLLSVESIGASNSTWPGVLSPSSLRAIYRRRSASVSTCCRHPGKR